MSSVNAIQPNEPRVQPSGAPQTRGGEPFSELLESAASTRGADADARKAPSKRQEPSAPPSQGKARADALARDESGGTRPAAKPVGTSSKGGSPEDSQTRAIAASGANLQSTGATIADSGETGDGAEPPTIGKLIIDANAQADNVVAQGDQMEEAEVSAEIASSPVPEFMEGEAEDAGETVAAAELTPGDKPSEAIPEAVPATVEGILAAVDVAQGFDIDDQAASPATPASKTDAASAPVSAPPAVPRPSDAEAAATSPAPINQARGALPVADQPQAQQVSPAGGAIAAGGEAATPFEGDADAQLPQRQNDAQPIQAKPQEAKATPQIEIAKPRVPAADAASSRAQPVILPEPVRALAASINPASLHAASMNEHKPLPLNASAIAVEIVSRLRDGMRRFDIRLDPPELGRIDVRLEMDRRGNVTTKLTLDRPETLDLMQRDARGLERALQQAGLKTDAGGLEFSLRSHADHHPAHGDSGRDGHRSDTLVAEDGERIEAVIEGYRSAAFARGGVDIRI